MKVEFRLPIEYRKNKVLDSSLQEDLHLRDGEDCLLDKLYSPSTEGQKVHFPKYASIYTTDRKFLKDTQKIIKSSDGIARDGAPERPTIGTADDDDVSHFLLKYGFFSMKPFRFLNNYAIILAFTCIYAVAAPALALLVPLMILIMPFFLLKISGRSITFANYVPLLKAYLRRNALKDLFEIGSATWEQRGRILISLAFYFLQLYINAENCIEHMTNLSTLHKSIADTTAFLDKSIVNLDYILENWNSRSTYQGFLRDAEAVKKKASSIQSKLASVVTYHISLSKIKNLGTTMRVWHYINTNKEVLDIIQYCDELNMFMVNLKMLRKTIKSKDLAKAQYGSATSISDMWHPSLETATAVRNSVSLNKNIVLTGPNAAGKTTIVKALLFNSVLSQQIGYGFFSKATIKLYDKFHSYINIPDTNARDSLFQAEAGRCKNILTSITDKPNNSHLCIFDELFSGTNPREATAAAKAFLEFIGKDDRVSFVLTTHYRELAKMETGPACKQMVVEITDNKIKPTYVMSDGVSTVDGGIFILRESGFPQEVVLAAKKAIQE